jgi:hypothetical protein
MMNELPEPVQLFRTDVGAHIYSLAGHFLNRKQAGSLILGMSHFSNSEWLSLSGTLSTKEFSAR